MSSNPRYNAFHVDVMVPKAFIHCGTEPYAASYDVLRGLVVLYSEDLLKHRLQGVRERSVADVVKECSRLDVAALRERQVA